MNFFRFYRGAFNRGRRLNKGPALIRGLNVHNFYLFFCKQVQAPVLKVSCVFKAFRRSAFT